MLVMNEYFVKKNNRGEIVILQLRNTVQLCFTNVKPTVLPTTKIMVFSFSSRLYPNYALFASQRNLRYSVPSLLF